MTEIRGLSWPFIASIAACVILAAPVWLVASPPMPDYPAHLASFYLIGGGASHFYKVQWEFLPNLAAEVLVPALANFMPLEIAGKIFLSITVWFWVLGPAAIHRALFGRVGLGALLAIPFTYNATFMWGFLNYTFTAGAIFFVFAAWIATADKRRTTHYAGFAVAFTLIYFSHLFALATLIVMLFCFELSELWRKKSFSTREIASRLGALVALFVPAAFFFLFLKPGSGGLNVQFNYLDTIGERLGAAIQFPFDQPAYVLMAAIAILVAIGTYTKRLTFSPRMSLVLCVLLICTLFTPEWALGSWGVHLRLPAVLGAVAFASAELRLSRRWMPLAITSILMLFLFQAATVASDWRGIDARYSDFRQHETKIAAKARLLTILDGDSLGWSSDQPYWHMAEFAVIDRDAFTPLLFSTKGQHVIQVLSPMARYGAAAAAPAIPPDLDELDDLADGNTNSYDDTRQDVPYLRFFQCHFDEAVVIHGDGPLSRVPTMLRLRYTGSFYAIYDILPDRRCAHR